MISIENLTFSYEEGKPILKNINMHINKGNIIVLAGRSGCGKTTLLKLLNGLIPHFMNGIMEGNVTINGKDIQSLTFKDISLYTGTVFQNPKSQFFCMNTTNELAFESENSGMNPDLIKENIMQCTEKMCINHLLNKNLTELTGGQKQMIACASVSIFSHDIIILDEPTANLDVQSIHKIKALITLWKEQGKTIIVAEHRLHYLIDLLDELIILEEGAVKWHFNQADIQKMSNERFNAIGLRSPWSMILEPGYYTENSSESYIEIENIKFKYKHDENDVLNIPKIKLPIGKVTALIGNNGCGKSTLANYLAGLEKDKPPKAYYKKKKIKLEKEIFMVFQDVNNQLSADTVLNEWKTCSKKCKDFENEAKRLLKKLNLEDVKEMNPQCLSGGEKQRVAIGEGVLSQSKLLILDEPTSGLDFINMIHIVKVIKALIENKHITVLLITHDYEFLSRLADEVIVLKNGRVYDQYELNQHTLASVNHYFKGSDF
ncbi:ABC transporter ATP-binding protein [Staphylococcus simulans]